MEITNPYGKVLTKEYIKSQDLDAVLKLTLQIRSWQSQAFNEGYAATYKCINRKENWKATDLIKELKTLLEAANV